MVITGGGAISDVGVEEVGGVGDVDGCWGGRVVVVSAAAKETLASRRRFLRLLMSGVSVLLESEK